MKKKEILEYLVDNLEYDVEYLTEAVFLDKAHKRLLSFSCGRDNPGKNMVSVVQQ